MGLCKLLSLLITFLVTVNFQQSAYTVQESSRRRNIQLLLSSALSEPISVVISAENITAVGKQDTIIYLIVTLSYVLLNFLSL